MDSKVTLELMETGFSDGVGGIEGQDGGVVVGSEGVEEEGGVCGGAAEEDFDEEGLVLRGVGEGVVEVEGDGGICLGGLPVMEFEVGHGAVGWGDRAEGVDLFCVGVVADGVFEAVLFEGLVAEGLFVVKGGGEGRLTCLSHAEEVFFGEGGHCAVQACGGGRGGREGGRRAKREKEGSDEDQDRNKPV